MKTSFGLALALALAIFVAGCDNQSNSSGSSTNAPATTNSGSLVTAPVDYLGSLAKAQQSSVKTIDTASLNHAIELFQADKGRNPKDLNELVQEKYIGKIPETPYGTKLDYDPNSGTVKVVKQ